MRQKEYIENIKNRQLNSDKEFILDSLTGAIDRLQKAFPRYGSFLMEFVQNADDAESKSLTIDILEDTVKITNNGKTFSEEDVKSICKVGRSFKTAKEYIGYLGVGFKAVFLISECPQIYSGGYQFKFDKSAWEDPEHTPWQIIPLWVDTPPGDVIKDKTIFVLPIKTHNLLVKLREEVKPEHLNNRILLFLRYIKEIEINDANQHLIRRFMKFEVSKTSDYEIYQIQEYENGNLKTQDQWLIFRAICNVPLDVKNDYVTKEWERENVKTREVLIAFKLDDENNLIKEEKGTAHIGVFSFLPLKEIPSGLNFLLQADLLTSPGRGELARDCLWNNWLADEMYNLIVRKCIPTFLNHNKWKMVFTEILYSLEGGHELFEEHIKEPLNEYLKSNPVLIDENGTPSKAEELISVTEEMRKLLSDEDLKLLYPGKKIIHSECKPYSNTEIKEAPKDIYSFVISSESEELIKQKAKNKDTKWFKKLYSMLVEKYTRAYFYKRYYRYNVEHDDFWNKMHNLYRPIMLTNNYNVARINDCFTNPQKIRIPEQLKDKFKILHQEIAADEKFEEFRKKLNEERYYYAAPTTRVLRELTGEDIKNALKQQEALELDEKKWGGLQEKEKIEKIKEIKKLWDDYSIEIKNYSFMTLKSKSGKWIKPEFLIFPKEYKPEHNIEILANKNLIDILIDIHTTKEFVSPEFIANSTEDEIRRWLKFFEELGVDKALESEKKGGNKEKIVQRIGVLAALKYEKEKGRVARELGESEKQRGYDIESKSENEERYIEVKSTSDTSYDIFLTVNEFKALRDKKEKYFIYAVLDVLRNPTMYITQGDKLLEIEDTKVIMPFNKWRDITDDEFPTITI
ncbi:DUF3883 domain-containing protein [candidate division NPL-UPA2 bacterium]|nr:DUF3883 domain-containing protein [candidate division NPL-UPA2 bacterium]